MDFSSLRQVDPQQLAKFIQDEHPQTIALVLSHLDASQAAALLIALCPRKHGTTVAIRMAGLEQISPESVRTIAAVSGQKDQKSGRTQPGSLRRSPGRGGHVQPVGRDQIAIELLESLEQDDPTLSEGIRRFMFVFEDLASAGCRVGMKAVAGSGGSKVPGSALKGTSDGVAEAFSRRACRSAGRNC